MRSHCTLMLGMLLALSLPALAQEGPRLVLGNDPAGDDIRAVARKLDQQILAGDARAAAALFAGPEGQGRLLEAHEETALAASLFCKLLKKQFPSADIPDVQGLCMLPGGTPELLVGRPIILNGDQASIAEGNFVQSGMDLRRVAGKWKVTSLTLNYGRTEETCEALRTVSNAYNRVAAKIQGGSYLTVQQALRDWGDQVKPHFDKLYSPVHLAATQPVLRITTSDGAPPLPRALYPGELQSLLGQPIGSPRMKALIAALPGLPRMALPNTNAYIISDDAGIKLCFGDAANHQTCLLAVHLESGGADGCRAYAGPLPRGLSFGQTQRKIEQKLGLPISYLASPGGWTCAYDDVGLRICLANAGPRDGDNPLAGVEFFKPDPSARQPATQPAGAPPRLTFRLVAKKGAVKAGDPTVEMLRDPEDASGGARLPVLRDAVVDESQIDNVAIVDAGPGHADAGRLSIGLHMTTEGAQRLERMSATHIGDQIAVVLDGRIVTAPTIGTRMSKTVLIAPTRGDGGDWVRPLFTQMQQIVYKLPSTRPSSRGT